MKHVRKIYGSNTSLMTNYLPMYNEANGYPKQLDDYLGFSSLSNAQEKSWLPHTVLAFIYKITTGKLQLLRDI